MALVNLMYGLIRDVRGATAIEYSLIAALVAVALVAAVTFYGDALRGTFNVIGNALPD